MTERDPLEDERAFYDDTDYAELEMEPADDVKVVHRPAPRSTFALRLDANTIQELREVAQRYGTRPTQVARDWLVERLEREREMPERSERKVDIDRLEQRFGALERRLNYYITGSYARGTPLRPGHDVDVLAGLNAQAIFARELLLRLADDVSVEVPPDPGADLLVRGGDRSWVFQFKGGSADVIPSFKHIASLAKRLKARPVLVSSQPASVELEAMAISSGVLVTSPDDIHRLIDEIGTYISERTPATDADHPASGAAPARQRSRRPSAATRKS